jgi:hypothetical protein
MKVLIKVLIVLAIIFVPELLLKQVMPLSLLSLYSFSSWTDENAFAHHGKELLISVSNSTFMPLASNQGNQVRVLVNYVVLDSSILGEGINAVMKLYTLDGELIKTSSYPSGFLLQSGNGKIDLKSTLMDSTVTDVVADIEFTNQDKTEILSNDITQDMILEPVK